MSFLGKLKSLLKSAIYKTIGPQIFYRTATLSDGTKIKVDVTDVLGIKLYNNKEPHDVLEIESVKKLLRKGDTCLDIGANIGLYTINMARAVGITGKVYSFEPGPDTFKILCENIKLNSLENVFLSETAVSDKTGNVEMVITLQSGLSGLGDTGRGTVVDRKRVEVITIDDFVEKNSIEKIDLIKIDVEGFEGTVLKGAEKLLRRMKDMIVLAELDKYNFESHGFNRWEVVKWMAEIGYGAWSIDRKAGEILRLDDNNKENVINMIFCKSEGESIPLRLAMVFNNTKI